jgi:hypothetical protein
MKKLDGASSDIGKRSSQNFKDIENSSAKLFEEIKIMFQDLPSRIERANPSEGRRRKRRFHPGIFEELMHFSKDPKIGVKMALSLYRERMPWIYDEGIQLLSRLESSKTTSTTKRLLQDFEEMLMRSTRNPFVEGYLIDDEEEFVLFMELPRIILRNLEHLAH